MKKKLTNNLGMKILSLAIALICWIVIVNIDDPVITKTFPGISVDIIHEEAINSLNQVYEVVEGDVVNITVKGKKSIVDSLKSSDLKAEADLNKLSSVNAVPILPYVTKQVDGELDISLGKVDTLRVTLEDVEEKQFQVTVVQKGTVQDGYSIGDIKVKPNLIKVSGAASQISRIAQVRVELDVSNASEAISKTLEPKVYDSNGYLIDSSNMTFSSPEIKVTAQLLNTKKVPLLINTTGDPASGYQFVNIDYEPKQITIAGEQSTLDDIKYIAIKLDITNSYENIEEEVNINDYIPDGVKVEEDNETAMVNITIEKMQQKEINFNSQDLEVKNTPSDLNVHLNNVSQLSVNVLGTSKVLSNITIDDLNPYIDLSGLKKGNHTVPIQFSGSDEVQIISSLSISVQLTEKNDNSTDDGNSSTENDHDSNDNSSSNGNNTNTESNNGTGNGNTEDSSSDTTEDSDNSDTPSSTKPEDKEDDTDDKSDTSSTDDTSKDDGKNDSKADAT